MCASFSKPVTKKKKKNAVEDYLLRLIFDCPPIWNHTINVKERNPEVKSRKWIGIHNEMIKYIKACGHCIDVSTIKMEMLKDTWNKIRETYVRYKNDSQFISGSATKEVDPPEHFEVMRAYDRMIVKRK